MHIDIPTILLFSAVNSLYLFFLLLFFLISGRGRQWYLKTFVGAKTLITIGILLVALRGVLPSYISLLIANMLTFCGYNLELLSVTSFDGKLRKKSAIFYTVIATLSCLLFASIVNEQDYVRVSIMGLFSVIPIAYTGIYFIKYKPATPLLRFIGYSYILTSSAHFFRAIHALHLGSSYRYMVTQDNYEVAFFAIVNLSFFLGTVGFVMVLKEQAERRVITINEKLKKEKKTLSALNKERNNFFSIISHDLKGPIGGLMGLSEILKSESENISEEYGEMVDLIHSGATETYNLLTNLLEWANSQSSLNAPQFKQVDMYELVESNIALASQQAGLKSIQLINELNKDTLLFADPRMTNTIVRNLLVNAIKFTPNHGVIKVMAEQPNETYINFCVSDNGIGMDSKTRNGLFQLDSRITTPGTNNESGTGLGLQLCKELIETMGGEIWVNSTLKKGSDFWFSLRVNKS